MRAPLMVLLLCSTALPASAQDDSAIRQASQQFTSALSSGNAASAVAMFTDDAVALPPGRKELTGKSEIQMFLNAMTRNVQNLQYTSETVTPIGDNAAREIGSFSFKMKGRNGGGSQDVKGKYLLVWQRSGSDWKIAADMWNRNASGQQRGGGKGRSGGRSGGGGAGAGGGEQNDMQQ